MAVSILVIVLAAIGWGASQPPAEILTRIDKLPVALNDDFQFRKTKLFYLDPNPPKAKKSFSQALAANANPNNPTAGIAEASLGFERTYRLFGGGFPGRQEPALRQLSGFLLARETSGERHGASGISPGKAPLLRASPRGFVRKREGK